MIKKVDEMKYMIEFPDEDIIRERNRIDLGEEGVFISEYGIIETDEEGKIISKVELVGAYIIGEIREDNISLFVTLEMRELISLKDIRKGDWTLGEIISLPWIDWSVF